MPQRLVLAFRHSDRSGGIFPRDNGKIPPFRFASVEMTGVDLEVGDGDFVHVHELGEGTGALHELPHVFGYNLPA